MPNGKATANTKYVQRNKTNSTEKRGIEPCCNSLRTQTKDKQKTISTGRGESNLAASLPRPSAAVTTKGQAVTTEGLPVTTYGIAVTTEGLAVTTEGQAVSTEGQAVTTEDQAVSTEGLTVTTEVACFRAQRRNCH